MTQPPLTQSPLTQSSTSPHTPSLYERIGGQAAVTAAVAGLYEKILSDELLIPFFENIDVTRLRASQSAFVTYAFGGPPHYNGKAMRNAHAKLVERGLSDIHFNAVARHFENVLTELNVARPLIDEALAVVETTRHDVLNR